MASEVKRALESTESLIASLRNVTTPTDTIDHDQLSPHKHPPPLDVEQSLLGTGEGLILPITSTHQAAPTPLNIESSPVNTLSSLVNRSLINGIDGSVDPVYLQEQLYQAEKDLHLSAKVGLALAERVDFLEKEVNRLTIHSGSVERSLKQCQHELVRKDSLLKLYYKQELEEGEEQPRPPQWVETLKEENVQLKSAMESLTEDNAKLQHDLEMALAKEKTLVKECYGQLTETKEQLLRFQDEMERQENEIHNLQTKLDESYKENECIVQSKDSLTEEVEDFKEKMSEAQIIVTQLSVELMDYQEKYDSVYTLMKAVQEENKMLKELTSNTSTPRGGGTDTPSEGSEHHESIVHEIEEVLRRELIEASSMADRPVSPNHYAQQRTMVVMETVKAATLATARKLEKLAAEQRKKEEDLSSQSLIGPLPDDISKLRHQHSSYFSPQKLQIVKPMEGSVTLLRWKLLATPQLRDPSSLIENDRPGVHLKNYSVLSSEPNPSLLKVNSLANKRKWHSVCDLPSQTTSRSASSNIPQKIISRPTEKQNAIQPQLSTVGKIKQNIWGLLSPSSGLKDKPSSESSGLGELLGP